MSLLSNRLQSEQIPLVDGDRATFVWKGKKAPLLQGDFTDWERGSPVRLDKAGRDLWVYRASFPLDAYIEYSFIDGDTHLLDPLNPRRTPNGLGVTYNYLYMPAASPTPLRKWGRGVPRGQVSHYKVDTGHLAAGKTRDVYLYQPCGDEPCPLLVVWDGQDFLRRGRLVQIVDNLIHQGHIHPVAMALVAHGGSARIPEYACSESTLAFLIYQVLPLAREHLNLLESAGSPGVYGVLGASMGGLMALYTAMRLPEVFGRVHCLSGGFWLEAVPSIMFDLVRKFDLRPLKIWMAAGLYDFQELLKSNRILYELLCSRGYDVVYREFPAGHNYPAWRDEVWRGLEHLFAPMVIKA